MGVAMPFTRKQVQRWSRPLDIQVLEYLDAQPEQGFSAFEVYCGIHGHDVLSVFFVERALAQANKARIEEPVEQCLRELEKEKKVEVTNLHGTNFYFSMPSRLRLLF